MSHSEDKGRGKSVVLCWWSCKICYHRNLLSKIPPVRQQRIKLYSTVSFTGLPPIYTSALDYKHTRRDRPRRRRRRRVNQVRWVFITAAAAAISKIEEEILILENITGSLSLYRDTKWIVGNKTTERILLLLRLLHHLPPILVLLLLLEKSWVYRICNCIAQQSRIIMRRVERAPR